MPVRSQMWQAAVLLGLLWLTMAGGSVRSYTYEYDSVNYALGVRHFDIAIGQPHPPGYPLFILVGKGLDWLVGDPCVALILLAALFTAAAAPCFFVLARRIVGPWGALAGATALAFAPPVLLNSSVVATYAVDLFASCLIGWLVALVLEGNDWCIVPALAAAATLAGFRPTGVSFLAPLLLAASVATLMRRAYRTFALGVAAASLLGAAWFLPVSRMVGGLARWRQLTRELWVGSRAEASVFYGAPWPLYRNMVETFFVQVATALAAIAVCLLVWMLVARAKRADGVRHHALPGKPRPAWDVWWFYLLWIAPCAVSDLLFLYAKPGYMLLLLPPCFLVATKILDRALVRAGGQSPAYVLTAAGIAAGSLALGYAPVPGDPYGLPIRSKIFWATPASAKAVQQAHDQLAGLFDRYPDRDAILAIPTAGFGPVWRTLSYDFPGLLVGTQLAGQWKLLRNSITLPDNTLPTSLRAIYWINWQTLDLKAVRQTFPDTEFVFSTPLFTIWRSRLSAAPIDEILNWNGSTIRLRRAANPAIAPAERQITMPRIAMGKGFSGAEPTGSGYCVWALGPEATVDVYFPPGWKEPAKVRFAVQSVLAGVTATLAVNGKPDRRIEQFRREEPIEVLAPPSEHSTVTFRFALWNGYPQVMVPQDSRPMAVMFRGIRMESGAASVELLER